MGILLLITLPILGAALSMAVIGVLRLANGGPL